MAKKRFWNSEVHISQKMYENSQTAMCILRVLGIFPLVIKRKALGLYLKYSPLYALYSCLLGATTLSAIYYRVYEELNIETKATHVGRSTDKFVRFTAINAFCLMVFYAVYIMPTKLLGFFKYIKYIGQVDNIINTTFLKSNRYRSLLILTMPLMYNISTDCLDVYYNYRNYKKPLMGTLRRNISYYTTYIIGFAVICVNSYIANCLEIRVVEMNKILNQEYLNIKMDETSVKRSPAISKVSKDNIVSVIYQNSDVPFSHSRASIVITKVTEAYLKWMKAAEMVSYLYGIIIMLAMIAILCHLVCSKYFLILTLEGRGRDIVELFDWIAVFSVQILRVLLVIEPWHSCVAQLELLKSRVCNLLALNLHRCCREKIHSFAKILYLCQYRFTACGLFIVDRLLYTTLVDVVVTFLVISLQAEEQDTT